MATSKEHKTAAAKRAAYQQDPAELRAALESEKAGYVARGLGDRAKQVDLQLKSLGKPSAPSTATAQAGATGSSATRGKTAIPKDDAKSTSAAQAPDPNAAGNASDQKPDPAATGDASAQG